MLAQKTTEAAPMRIAFNHIPDLTIESDQTFTNTPIQKPSPKPQGLDWD